MLELRDHLIGQAVACLEVFPRGVWLHRHVRQLDRFGDVAVRGHRQICLDLVKRAKAHIPATSDVESKKIGTDADKIVPDSIHHLEVDLFRWLLRKTTQDRVHAVLGIAGLWRVPELCQCLDCLCTC